LDQGKESTTFKQKEIKWLTAKAKVRRNHQNANGGNMPSWKRASGKKVKLSNPETKKTVEVVENSDEHRMLLGHGYSTSKKAGRPKKDD